MVSSALDMMTRKTAWAGTDVLLADMPPGTGDAQVRAARWSQRRAARWATAKAGAAGRAPAADVGLVRVVDARRSLVPAADNEPANRHVRSSRRVNAAARCSGRRRQRRRYVWPSWRASARGRGEHGLVSGGKRCAVVGCAESLLNVHSRWAQYFCGPHMA